MKMKHTGFPAFCAAIALALPLTGCGGLEFEEYPSAGVTPKAGAQSTADLTRAGASPTPEFFDDVGKAGIAWLDHLKTCTPYSQTYQSPYLKVMQVNTIQGMEGDRCLITMATTGYAVISCRLDSNGIKAFTSEELYAAMADIYSAKSDPASSTAMAAQCEYTILGPTEVFTRTPTP